MLRSAYLAQSLKFMDTTSESGNVAPRPIPAWLLSLAVHVGFFVLLALIVRGPTIPSAVQKDKAVGIVLATTAASEATYFDATTAPAETPETKVETNAPAESLPDSADSLLTEDIELPTLDDSEATLGVGVGVVATPNFDRGGGGPTLPGEDLGELIAAEQALMAARKKSSGPATSLAPFGGTAAVGNSFVFLLDRSRSMGSEGLGALPAAETELKNQLKTLGPEHKFQVIAYNHKASYVGSRTLLAANATNVGKLPEFFTTMAAIGKTEHEMALLAAIRLKPDVIFLLTDGGVPGMSPSQVKRVVERTAGVSTIHSFEFGLGKPSADNEFLRALAEATGGSYAFLDLSKTERSTAAGESIE